MKTVVVVILCGIFLLAVQHFCWAADLTVSHISLAKIFEKYQKVNDSNNKLNVKKNQIRDLIEEIKGLDKNTDQLSDQGKQERQKELQAKQEKLRNLTIEVRKEEDEVLKQILQDIEKSANELRKNKKLTYIIDDRLVISGPQELDVTEDLIKILNERYKGK